MSTLTFKVHLGRGTHGQLEMRAGAAPAVPPPPKVPARIARLVALAHRLEGLVRSGVAPDYAAVAAVGHVTRARVSQYLNLLLLAPDIQEQLLDMVKPDTGREPIGERDLRSIVAEPDWEQQRVLFEQLINRPLDGRKQTTKP